MSSFRIIGNINKPKKQEVIKESSSKSTTFKLPEDIDPIVTRICKCINSPNGDYNLFGYITGKFYKVRYMGLGKNGKPYVRLYKNYDIDKEDIDVDPNGNEYDTITVFNYQYYFKTMGIDEERSLPLARSKRK